MTQTKYTAPDNTTQTAQGYKNNIDNAFQVQERGAGIGFQAHEQTTPDMTIELEAGQLFDLSTDTLNTQAAQSTGTITAPSVNPRIDRVTVDRTTLAVVVTTGVEDASPVAPAFPANSFPVCQIALTTSTTQIFNTDITDERVPIADATTASGISAVVEDTTPQLGGQLDVNGFAIGDGTLELIKFVETASAVNELTVTNAATAGAPSLSATGDDTNIDLSLLSKGTGRININATMSLGGTDIRDSNGNELIFFFSNASAVNNVLISNHSTGNAPQIQASGSDTNIDLDIDSKGSGNVVIDGVEYPNSGGTTGDVLTLSSANVADWAAPAGGGGGKLLKTVHATSQLEVSTSAQIPTDGTLPQATEGTEFLSLAYTPAQDQSRIVVKCFVTNINTGNNNTEAVITINESGNANSRQAGLFAPKAADEAGSMALAWSEGPGHGTAARTFSLRFGSGDGVDTVYIGQDSSATEQFGGLDNYTLTVEEWDET